MRFGSFAKTVTTESEAAEEDSGTRVALFFSLMGAAALCSIPPLKIEARCAGRADLLFAQKLKKRSSHPLEGQSSFCDWVILQIYASYSRD